MTTINVTPMNISQQMFLCKILCIFLMVLALVASPTFGLSAPGKQLKDDLFSVTFATENLGWACGGWGAILHTADGGKTWMPQDSGTDFTLTSIFFVDQKTGWTVGDGGTILHTVNGGKTWQKQKSPVPFFHMGVYFISPHEGWIASERTHILHTQNGGQTWTVQFKADDYILKSVSFADAHTGWAVGEYGFTYFTKDGGKNWIQQAGKFGVSEETGEIIGDPFLFSVVAVDSRNAWAVGIDGCVRKTVDAGKTWSEIKVGAHKTAIFSVRADRRKSVVLVGDGMLMVSPDDGKTWKSPKLDVPLTYSWLYGLAVRGTAGFVAVGAEGLVYRGSLDSWSKVQY